MKPTRSFAVPAALACTAALAIPLTGLTATATPAPPPTLSFTMEPIPALTGKYCRPAIINPPSLIAADCEDGPVVVKDGKPVELKKETAAFTVDKFSIQVGNAAGWLAGGGTCTRKQTGALSQPCVVRWNPSGELRGHLIHEIGSPLADLASVTGMNSHGDVVFTEIFTDGHMSTYDSRVWWAHGNRYTPVVPNRYQAAVAALGITDDGVVSATQWGGTDKPPAPAPTATTSTPPPGPPTIWPSAPAPSSPAPTATSTPAPTPTTAPTPPSAPVPSSTSVPAPFPFPTSVPTAAPTVTRPPVTPTPSGTVRPLAGNSWLRTPKLAKPFTMSRTELLSALRQEDLEFSVAVIWHPRDKVATSLPGLDQVQPANWLRAVSPNGWYRVGRATARDVTKSVRFFDGAAPTELPLIGGTKDWLPNHVNNDGVMVGNVLGSAPDFLFTPVYVDPLYAPTELTPATVDGLKGGAPLEVLAIDHQGRAVAATQNGDVAQTVLLTPKLPSPRR